MTPTGVSQVEAVEVRQVTFADRIADITGLVPGSTIARRALLVLAVGVVTAIVRYLIQVIFARQGGAAAFGTYSFAFGWTQVLVVPATLGLTLSVLRFVPQYIQEERWSLLRGLIRRSCQVTALSGAVFTGLGIGFVLITGAGASQTSLIIGLTLVGLVGLVTVIRETTRGTHKVVTAYGVGELLPMALILVAAIGLPAITGSISAEQMLLVTGLGFALALSVQWLTLRRTLPSVAQEVAPTFDMRAWMLLSVPLWLVSMFTLMINQSDLLVLGILKSPTEVGVYAAGSKTAWLVSFVLTAVSAVLAPVFVRHHAAGNIDELRKTVRSGTRLIFWPSLALAALLFLWPQLILDAFGSEFTGATTVVRILAVGQLVNAITGPAGYLLLLTGAQATVARVYGASAVVQVILLLTLVPSHGTTGAATITAATIVVSNSLLYLLARRRLSRELVHGGEDGRKNWTQP
jgi:O-antigen/teichoic acid export membrane protein